MESLDQRREFLKSIIDEAGEDARVIADRAGKERSLADADHLARIERITTDATRRAAEEIARFRDDVRMANEIANRRRRLVARKNELDEIVSLARRRLSQTDGARFEAMLIEWSVEAIVGVDSHEVNLESDSPGPKILERVVAEIEGRSAEISGHRVKVIGFIETRSGDPGVVASDRVRSRLYDNRLRARFDRYSREITAIAQTRLGSP